MQAVQDENATIVVLYSGWGLQVSGSSKRNPDDPKDYPRGYRIALGRALLKLGRDILKTEKARGY